MGIDKSLARGLVKREHRKIKARIDSLCFSTRERKGAALKQNLREVRRAFRKTIILEMKDGKKKKEGVVLVLLNPISYDRYSVDVVVASWKDPIPRHLNLFTLSRHSMERIKLKQIDLRSELHRAVLNMMSLRQYAEESLGYSQDEVFKKLGESNYALYTTTGRWPLVWSDEGILLVPTWIADSWSSPVVQEVIRKDRVEGKPFFEKS